MDVATAEATTAATVAAVVAVAASRESDVKAEKEEELNNGGGNGGGGAGLPSRTAEQTEEKRATTLLRDTFTENYATAIDATVVSSTFFGSLQNRSIAAPFRRIFLAQRRAFANV